MQRYGININPPNFLVTFFKKTIKIRHLSPIMRYVYIANIFLRAIFNVDKAIWNHSVALYIVKEANNL